MKKLSSIILTFLFVFISAVPTFSAPLYKSEEVIPISKSITLTKVKEFYSDHNISYSYIKANLNDQNTSVKLLKSSEGVDKLETVGNLAATEKDTVAAINSDFFSVHSGSKGFSLGIEVKDGELLASPINPGTMASISYAENTLAMNYLDFHIMAVAPNRNYHEIRHLNKHTSYYGDILMYTSDFNNGYSPAPGGEVVEVVVEDGIIKEFRRKMPAVKIPENGCVLVVSEGANMFFANNFNVGDPIKFDYYITPDISDSDIAVGGGAMLVSEGKALTKFSHVVSGYNPRSAVGMSSDGKTLYLVAVDGRQTSSRGMTMSEMANLMKDLGCYNAVNLDGGGSTNMVASTSWNEELTKVNSPTENRKVINAIGISYDSDNTKAANVLLKPDKETVFIGDSVNFSAAVCDVNMRPIGGDVVLSSAYGKINGNTFTATVGGDAVVFAQSGTAAGHSNIYVIDSISGIEVTEYISLNKSESANIDISVFDKSGHYAKVTNTGSFTITSSDNSVVSVSGSKITAKKDGTAIISISKDGITSYTSVCVGGNPYTYTETFEFEEGSFSSYPVSVPGSFTLSDKIFYGGKKSGQINFDFTEESDTTKAVYYNLSSKKTIDSSSDKVSVMFYSENDFNHSLRAQFTDSAGTVHRVVFGKNLKGGTWHNLNAYIPENAVRPVTLDKIYAAYIAGEAKDAGAIYIDNLSYTLSGNAKFEAAKPNVYAEEHSGNMTGNIFRVGSLIKNPKTLVSGLVNSHMTSVVSQNKSNAVLGEIKAFSKKEDGNALYISLNTSGGGIRATDSSQWNSMANAIYYSSKNNVVIMSDNSLYGNDSFENEAIKGYLENLSKNVIVITTGEKNTYKNENGVMYFTLCNSEKEALSNQKMSNYRYLEISFDNGINFSWKKLYN